jgi:NADPH2:quinone reductase
MGGMKAIVCRAFGQPEQLTLDEVEPPTAGEGQLSVAVAACSVGFPDLLIVQGRYQLTPPLPFTPGTEVAGVVAAVGPGVTGFSVGDRVLAPTTTGGLAEQLVLPARRAVRLADDADLREASTLLYSYGTSQHALRDRARLQPGETLLVLGAAGGVGLTAVEIGSIMGATVIAAASTPDKRALCVARGAAHAIDYVHEDLKARVRELTDGRGVDVVYDAVGGPYAEPALRALALDGRYLVVGFASGEIPAVPLNLTLLRGTSIVGVYLREFARQHPTLYRERVDELLRWWGEGRIRPHISRTYALAEAPQALRDLADRVVRGKAVVDVAPSDPIRRPTRR